MCEPTTMAVLAIASAGVSAYATHQSAKAQSDAMKAQAETERLEATASAEEQMGVKVRAAREARARARVAAGESGAMGASFAASINQSLQDQDMDNALAAKNLSFQQRGIDDRLATGLSQVRDVSALEAGLSIASAGVSGYQTGLSIQNAKSYTKRKPKAVASSTTTTLPSAGTMNS